MAIEPELLHLEVDDGVGGGGGGAEHPGEHPAGGGQHHPVGRSHLGGGGGWWREARGVRDEEQHQVPAGEGDVGEGGVGEEAAEPGAQGGEEGAPGHQELAAHPGWPRDSERGRVAAKGIDINTDE